jgi:hypothetical protein
MSNGAAELKVIHTIQLGYSFLGDLVIGHEGGIGSLELGDCLEHLVFEHCDGICGLCGCEESQFVGFDWDEELAGCLVEFTHFLLYLGH